MKRFLFAFLSFFPVLLFGQNTIRGIVVDSLTQEPLILATVYVNGTTQGTTTDNDGLFELKECKSDTNSWSGTQLMITPKGRETFRLLRGRRNNTFGG